MAFDGNGVFVIDTAGQPVAPNTVISTTVFNALTADLANGLTLCITKDGQSTPTANIPLGGFKLTGVGDPTTPGDALTYEGALPWTPVDASGAGITLIINGAGYTPIGNLNFVWADISYDINSDPSPVTIGGLPRTIQNTANVGGSFTLSGPGGGTDFFLFIPNSVAIQAYTSGGVNRTNAQYSNQRLRFQMVYPS